MINVVKCEGCAWAPREGSLMISSAWGHNQGRVSTLKERDVCVRQRKREWRERTYLT